MSVRWGILGCGSIARAHAAAVKATDGAVLAAVGSRSLEKAQAFAGENGGERAYGSYEELVSDPGVDAIYVATPHPMHCEDTLLCLEHGKAVLCEKPFALNAGQAEQMAAKAKEKQLFLMEAMWTRFFPISARVREVVASGQIGDLKIVSADFGFRADFDPKSRLFAPELGGGAMLDVGVYAISYASMLLGKPSKVASLFQPAPTGVDEISGYLLGYESGAMAVLHSAVGASTAHEATVVGTKGRIRIPNFWRPSKMIVTTDAGEEAIDLPYDGNGYQFQVAEVERCLAEGSLQSETMPLHETISIMKTMDSIREQWSLRYPGE